MSAPVSYVMSDSKSKLKDLENEQAGLLTVVKINTIQAWKLRVFRKDIKYDSK